MNAGLRFTLDPLNAVSIKKLFVDSKWHIV